MQPADPSPPPPSVLPYPSPSSVPSGAPVSGTPLLAEDEVEDEPVAFWERKRTGQATGTGLVAASVCGLTFMFASRVWLLPWSSRLNDGGPPFWFGLAAGAASLALGFYLVHYKHYLRDPQARKQYRSEFRRQPFVVSLRNFGWDGLVQFLRAEVLCSVRACRTVVALRGCRVVVVVVVASGCDCRGGDAGGRSCGRPSYLRYSTGRSTSCGRRTGRRISSVRSTCASSSRRSSRRASTPFRTRASRVPLWSACLLHLPATSSPSSPPLARILPLAVPRRAEWYTG